MNMRRIVAALSLSTIALAAAQRDLQTVQTVVRAGRQDAGIAQYLVALPHMAYGGVWRTKIIIRNTSGTSADVTINYFGGDGNPLSVPFGGILSDHTTVTVPANGEQEVEPDWSGPDTGAWAGLIYSNAGVKIQGVFLWRNPSDPAGKYIESTASIISQVAACIVPLPGSTSYTMPYDETEGRFSGYGFANTTATPVTLNLKFYDQNGAVVGQYSQQFPGFGHDQFLLRDKVPQLLNGKGTMEINGAGMAPLGFRFTPYYTFTTWLP